jgi:hypothetical protein
MVDPVKKKQRQTPTRGHFSNWLVNVGPWPIYLVGFMKDWHQVRIGQYFWNHSMFISSPWKNCRVATYGRKKITKLSPHQVHPHGLWHHSQAMTEKRTYFKPAMTVFNHTTIYELCNISADFWWFNPVISQLPPLSDLDLFQWQIFGGHIYFPNPWLAGPSYNFSGRQGIAINWFYGMLNLQFL